MTLAPAHFIEESALQTALVLLYNGRAPDVVCVCTTSQESEREGDADP